MGDRVAAVEPGLRRAPIRRQSSLALALSRCRITRVPAGTGPTLPANVTVSSSSPPGARVPRGAGQLRARRRPADRHRGGHLDRLAVAAEALHAGVEDAVGFKRSGRELEGAVRFGGGGADDAEAGRAGDALVDRDRLFCGFARRADTRACRSASPIRPRSGARRQRSGWVRRRPPRPAGAWRSRSRGRAAAAPSPASRWRARGRVSARQAVQAKLTSCASVGPRDP